MGKPTGFMEYTRELPQRRSVDERTRDWKEIYTEFPPEKVQTQSARCMDCGIPFCHSGCPVNNVIPHWNDLVYRDRWKEAIAHPPLHEQFSGVHRPHLPGAVRGRVRPRHQRADPVTIKVIERAIVDHAFKKDGSSPNPR